MYILRSGKKLNKTPKNKKTHNHIEHFKLPSQVIMENFKGDSETSKWLYIIIGIIVLIFGFWLVWWLVNRNKDSNPESPTKQRFGFRFY